MWWIIQELFPNTAIDAWVLVGGALFWIGAITWHPYICRQIPGFILWTDILNMITVGMFNSLPTWWWAHGWTIALLPWIGRFWVTVTLWVATLIMFGPTLFDVGLNIY
jgi:hypothetical protein